MTRLDRIQTSACMALFDLLGEAFAKEQGFKKCGLAPGIVARLNAEFIIESLA